MEEKIIGVEVAINCMGDDFLLEDVLKIAVKVAKEQYELEMSEKPRLYSPKMGGIRIVNKSKIRIPISAIV